MASGPTTLLNTVTLSEFVDLTRREWSLNQEMVSVGNAKQLFITSDETANTGNSRIYHEADTETFGELKREGEDAKKAQVGVGYNITVTAKRIAKEIDITWEMRRYNRYPEVEGQLTALNHFCPQRMELDLTHRFTFASSTSYTDLDGDTVATAMGDTYALCYATHGLAFSSSTYRNRVSGDPLMSQGALEAAELLTVTNLLSNFGERRVMNFNTIITGDDPNTCRTVRQILESTADIDAVQSGILNTYKGSYRHVILPYLATTATGAYDSTKRRWWFLGAIGNGSSMSWQAYCGVWENPNLKTPAVGNNLEDGHNDNWTFGTRAAYGIAALSGRGLIGSLPTS